MPYQRTQRRVGPCPTPPVLCSLAAAAGAGVLQRHGRRSGGLRAQRLSAGSDAAQRGGGRALLTARGLPDSGGSTLTLHGAGPTQQQQQQQQSRTLAHADGKGATKAGLEGEGPGGLGEALAAMQSASAGGTAGGASGGTRGVQEDVRQGVQRRRRLQQEAWPAFPGECRAGTRSAWA